MAEPLLRMTGVQKAFAGVPALRDASLTIQPGEVHALVGQNGAGKSTLINILTGVYRRDAGEVLWQGRPVELRSPRDAQGAGIATIYQELTLVPQRTVTENIVLGYEPRTRWGSIDWRAAEARAREVLGRFGIDLDLRRPLGAYPTAIQQLVAIGRAASMEARLLIMDEPTSSLDEREVEVLFGVIRSLRDRGTSILYVSHFLDELFQVCDGVTIMRDGRTVGEQRIAETTKLDLIAGMLGRDPEEIRAAGRTRLRAERTTGGEVFLEARRLSSDRRLRRLDLTVRAGEIVGLAGLLGSGRTEAARAIFGLDRVTGGTLEIGGRAARIGSAREAIDAGLAYLSEDRKAEGIVPDLSVRENLTLALLPRLSRLGIVDEARERRIVEGFIAALGIRAADMDQPIRELSGGNQQKVLLGRWLALEPRLLILDEPTRGVDVGAKLEIQAIIRKRVEEGCAVLLISSEFEELIEGAHGIIVLQEGRSVRRLENPGVTEAALIHAIAEPPEETVAEAAE
ncbi:sugar ABC transporter ATP-binding protein [Rubellimicrobium aerolatum]|uniref:Sugar ABC transporter ATP-binding protein n=1 Tax=Rubellimicrobium aerolatum TaxID=490979 RepID=A0ABW0SFN6_9RHOB|nr:sugar ABC transporter ATP-binding protein [Rubellimicrobium aerolatum]MBP1807240.1 ribose transport system ATP-binding protein [Rubellimicrobium aerolatum]